MSLLAIYTTLFSSFSFVGNSLVGMFFASVVIFFYLDKIKVDTFQAFSIAALLIYLAFVLILVNDKFVFLQNIRYWFGVLIYILFFIARPDTRLISFGFVRFLCVSILVESLLINTVISSTLLHTGSNETQTYLAMNWYERPLSFTGNASTTGVSIIVLFFLVERLLNIKVAKLDWLLLVASVVALFSGTTFAAFILLLIFRLFSLQQLRYVLMRLSIPLLLIIYILFNADVDQFRNFSIDYFIEIFDYKLLQLDGSLGGDVLNQLFGSQLVDANSATSGDFGWLIFLEVLGWLGVAVYFLLVISFYRGGIVLFPVLLLMLIGTTHYPAAMSPAGQLIMAMILTLGPLYKKNRRNTLLPIRITDEMTS